MYDVIIIGGGIIGTNIARELSRFQLSVALLEKEDDIAVGATMANSGIVHAGFDALPGSVKAETNVRGNELFPRLTSELDVPFLQIGALVLGFSKEDIPRLEKLKTRGTENGVHGLEILSREEVLEKEPNLNASVYAALFAPSSGIVSPYELAIALAENAADNGVDFFLEEEVVAIKKGNESFVLATSKSSFESKVVINAAGIFADRVHSMLSNTPLELIARAGEYIVFDRTTADLVKHTVFQLPSAAGKGILVTPTVDGNLLLGPTAMEVSDKSDTSTTNRAQEEIVSSAARILHEVPLREKIRSFTGLRAHFRTGDFLIGAAEDVDGLITVAGIESPGLTAAPAISERVVSLVGKFLPLVEKSDFNPHRKRIPRFRDCSNEERKELISKNPLFGKIICRCELVSEGEIIEAILRPVGARNLDAVKRRVRTEMGRCQGGFCSPSVLEILARELSLPLTQITQHGGGSVVLFEETRPMVSKEVQGES